MTNPTVEELREAIFWTNSLTLPEKEELKDKIRVLQDYAFKYFPSEHIPEKLALEMQNMRSKIIVRSANWVFKESDNGNKGRLDIIDHTLQKIFVYPLRSTDNKANAPYISTVNRANMYRKLSLDAPMINVKIK